LGVLDAHIRRRIRAIIVRQKKRPRFLLRHLLALGASRFGCRVLRSRRLEPLQPASLDARLPAVLVHRAAHLAQDALGRAQCPAGTGPAFAGSVIDRPKEPDAGPHVRFYERRGGEIHRAYSTRAAQRSAGGVGAVARRWWVRIARRSTCLIRCWSHYLWTSRRWCSMVPRAAEG
jgi:hypothetical protein